MGIQKYEKCTTQAWDSYHVRCAMSMECDKVFKTMPASEHGFEGFETIGTAWQRLMHNFVDARNNRLAVKRMTKRKKEKNLWWKKTSDRKKRGMSPYTYYSMTAVSHVPLPGYQIRPPTRLQMPCVKTCRLKDVDSYGYRDLLLSVIDICHARNERIKTAELQSWCEKHLDDVYKVPESGGNAGRLPYGTAVAVALDVGGGRRKWRRGRISEKYCNYPAQGWRKPVWGVSSSRDSGCWTWNFQLVDYATEVEYSPGREFIILPKSMAERVPTCMRLRITERKRKVDDPTYIYELTQNMRKKMSAGEDVKVRISHIEGMRYGHPVYSASFC